MPKRLCTSRAEWRLQPGKPAEPLSPHYRLDCDYGTGVITCWEEGGSEPIYVCGSHARQLGRPRRQPVTDIRIITSESVPRANPAGVEEAALISEPPGSGVAMPALETAAAPRVERDQPSDPPNTDERVPLEPVHEASHLIIAAAPVAAPAPKGAARPDAVGIPPETKFARAVDPPAPARSPVRDLTYGSPAKAIVDEAIWNLAAGNYQAYKAALEQGKSHGEAAEAAGGQLAMVHRKMGDYTSKLENLLSASSAKINVGEAVDKPLEQAVLEIIGSSTMSESEKDAAVQQLGALQEWVKQGVLGDLTLLEANRILLGIGDRLNWGGTADVAEQSKPAYRSLFRSLKSAIRTAVPEAQNLHDRLINLYAAKSDLEMR